MSGAVPLLVLPLTCMLPASDLSVPVSGSTSTHSKSTTNFAPLVAMDRLLPVKDTRKGISLLGGGALMADLGFQRGRKMPCVKRGRLKKGRC